MKEEVPEYRPIAADISLTLVYDCPICDQTNITNFDDVGKSKPDKTTMTIFKTAAGLIVSAKKIKKKVVKVKCSHCWQEVKIKEFRFW